MKTNCMIDVFTILNEGENYVFPIKNYNRIGKRIEDNFNLFSKNEVSLTPFTLITNKERLNFSIQNRLHGLVKLNPKTAAKVGLPKEIKSNIYRRKTLVKDGELNVESLELLVDTKTYFQLKALGLNIQDLENDTQYPGYHIILDLTKIQLINDNYKNYTMDSIMDNVKETFILEAKQKVVNSLLKSFAKESIPGFTEEQIEVLEEHGLDKNLKYIGVDNEEKEAEEEYSSKIIEFKIKGCGSLSSLNDVLKRVSENKKLNLGAQTMHDYYVQLKGKLVEMPDASEDDIKAYYDGELKSIKAQLFRLRLKSTIIKATMIQSPIDELAMETNSEYKYKDLTISQTIKTFVK